MTCKCPPHFCYHRPDCRHPKPRNNDRFQRRAVAHEAEARASVMALGIDWFYERRDALQAELADPDADVLWSPVQRRAKRDALALIEAAIARREKV